MKMCNQYTKSFYKDNIKFQYFTNNFTFKKKPGVQHPGLFYELVNSPFKAVRNRLSHLGGGLGTRAKPLCSFPSKLLDTYRQNSDLGSLPWNDSASGTMPNKGDVASNSSAK